MDKLYNDYNYMYNQYVAQHRTTIQIARELDVAESTIELALKKLGITTRRRGSDYLHPEVYDKDWLYNQYIVQHKNISQISKETGIARTTIHNNLEHFNIPRWSDNRNFIDQALADEIIDKYINQHMSIIRLAEAYNVSEATMAKFLRSHGVNIRSIAQAQYIHWHGQEAPEEYSDYDYMYQRYIVNGESSTDIAKDLNISNVSVLNQLHKMGIISGSRFDKVDKPTEKEVHGYSDSLEILARRYLRTYVNPKILYRDGNKCAICGSNEPNLEVHHIIKLNDIIYGIVREHPEYNPNDPIYKNKLYNIIIQDPRFLNSHNMITMCPACHHIHEYDYYNHKPWPGIYEDMVTIVTRRN